MYYERESKTDTNTSTRTNQAGMSRNKYPELDKSKGEVGIYVTKETDRSFSKVVIFKVGNIRIPQAQEMLFKFMAVLAYQASSSVTRCPPIFPRVIR